jgi:hypothetical protein
MRIARLFLLLSMVAPLACAQVLVYPFFPPPGLGYSAAAAALTAGTSASPGSYLAGTPDSAIARFESTEAITAHAHYGFLDDSTVNFAASGAIGHASFDSNVTFSGTQNDDHHHDYQAVSFYNSSGTLAEWSSFWGQPQQTTGTVTDMALFRGLNPIKSGGTITTLFGLYLQGLTGGVTNWGVYVDGNTPSFMSGGLMVSGARQTVSSAVSQINIGATAGGTPEQWWINSTGGVDSKAWDVFASATTFNFRAVNDSVAAAHSWLVVTRSGTTLTNIDLGNATDSSVITGNNVTMTPASGTFTSTYTGMAAATTCTSTWYKIGTAVTLTLCAATGTSNATGFTMTGLPAAIQPATISQDFYCAGLEDNTALLINGSSAPTGRITAGSGTVTFLKAGGAWTAAGIKGVANPCPVSFLTN